MDEKIREILIESQRSELTEHLIYRNLARIAEGKNREVLERISNEELSHHNVWKKYTGVDVKPNKFKIFFYTLIARIFSLTFAIKMMEKGETLAENKYEQLVSEIPEAKSILEDEERHESSLIEMIDEEKINYIGSMVLGINDAIVELTGAIAGLTFAMQNTRLVGLSGLIMGIAAALSMSASEYLSQKSESDGDKNPLKASFYTGLAYAMTVVVLVFPYFIFSNYLYSLALMFFDAVLVILFFTFFLSVVKDAPFKKSFLEMVLISFGVSFISFGIGLLARKFLNVDI